MKILAIIPARYASTRLPGKPLERIGAYTMIERVIRQVKQSRYITHHIVATDDSRIYEHVLQLGTAVMMTAASHPSGTDRCAEVLAAMRESFDFVINIQGDEPFIHPAQIDELCVSLTTDTALATQAKRITDTETLFSPNSPKLIFGNDKKAIYFSRHPIPYLRGIEQPQWLLHHEYYKHIGIYAYRADILPLLTLLPVGRLEQAESLEQLRWIEAGYSIQVCITAHETFGIDTPEDILKAIAYLQEHHLE